MDANFEAPERRPDSSDYLLDLWTVAEAAHAASEWWRRGMGCFMASYTANRYGVAQARKLIKAKQFVLDSEWGDVWRHKEVERAAYRLLQELDAATS
jgi:hypothetical protein